MTTSSESSTVMPIARHTVVKTAVPDAGGAFDVVEVTAPRTPRLLPHVWPDAAAR